MTFRLFCFLNSPEIRGTINYFFFVFFLLNLIFFTDIINFYLFFQHNSSFLCSFDIVLHTRQEFSAVLV